MYRLNVEWIEGIQWVRINSRCVRYILEMIQDWLQNRGNPKAHMQAIENYQRSLLSSKRKTKSIKNGERYI
jgi:hypothetical protein